VKFIYLPRVVLIFLVAAVFAPAARGGLTADQIALIVNKNVPESAQLAEFYAKARDVPDGRIIALDLPTGDEISFDQYERQVVPQVRKFLEDNGLTQKVTCLVTMYGVPLRVAAHVNSPEEQRELATLKASLAQAQTRLKSMQQEVEKQAAALDPTFAPLVVQVPPQASSGAVTDVTVRRLEHATQALLLSVQRIDDPARRQEKGREVEKLMRGLRDIPKEGNATTGPSTGLSTTASSSDASATPRAATNATTAEALNVEAMSVSDLIAHRYDAPARRRVRELAQQEGWLSYARALIGQIEYLTPEASDAAFDNELAMLWWGMYARPQWVVNVLNARFRDPDGPRLPRTPPVLMVSRLDGPSVQGVRDMIATSIQIEKRGLSGRIVIDAGGAAKLDPQHKQEGFWPFDRTFTNLMLLLRKKGGMQVVYDDGPEVLPPHTAKGVALYTGWYSVGNYVPSCDLVAGAVAYHVASYEMTSLHDPNNKGWCRGLLSDGAVATIGPVSEPYLHAFPLPDEFFPLLLTGKLTLAEVYWRSNPLTSWKMCLVGDPLYTPYKVDPHMEIPDVPEHLRGAFESPDAAGGDAKGRR
jgi:uncharacterized protein (TIGR03790 family)